MNDIGEPSEAPKIIQVIITANEVAFVEGISSLILDVLHSGDHPSTWALWYIKASTRRFAQQLVQANVIDINIKYRLFCERSVMRKAPVQDDNWKIRINDIKILV